MQIYGIRWLRLLFGREFSFRDTLLLWDTIFADSCPPSLCDQLVVALLVALRDLLLRYDYQDAVQLLMKLPSNLSVFYCSQFALYLKDPIRFPKPSGTAFTCGKRDPPTVPVNQRWRPTKLEGKLRRQTEQGRKKPARELEVQKPSDTFSTFSVEQDKISDFTVLDFHTDTNNQETVKADLDRQLDQKFHQLPSSSASSSSGSGDTPRARLAEEISGENLLAVVNKLEKLLRQEKHLSKSTDIFHCLGSLKKLMTMDSGKVKSKNYTKRFVSIKFHLRSWKERGDRRRHPWQWMWPRISK